MEPDIAGIERRLWAIADRVRATTPLYDYFSFVLALIFLRLADHRYAQATAEAGDQSQTPLDRAACQQRGCFYVPAQARFSYLLSLPEIDNSLHAVTSAMRLLESENSDLQGILTDKRWRMESHAVIELLHAIDSIPLDGDGAILTIIFDSCLRHTAVSDSRIDFATPNEVNSLLIRLAKPMRGMSVYDPCAGFGGILLEAARFVSGGNVTGSELSLFGQEVNSESLAICKMRLLLSGFKSADLRLGSSLTQPQHLDGDQLRTFDRVVSNPPFSLSPWHHGDGGRDPYNRYCFGMPPRSSGDYAFIQHMIASTDPTGSVAVLVAPGVLFRGGSEGRIRQGIVEADLVEAAIALPPGVLYGTDVSAAVLVLNKNKPSDRKGKTLFIDASRDFVRQGRRNCLSTNDVSRIADAFDAYANVERYARVVSLGEIRNNSFNLNVSRYADSSPMAGLVTQYSQYEKFTIRDVATQVNSVARNEKFEERDNAVYIPIATGRQPLERADQIPSGHDAYYQVVLNDRAISGYVAQFFRSSVGQHALTTLAQGGAIKRIRRSDLFECMVALPSVEVQQQIISTHQKLATLKDAITRLDQELSLNPTGQTEFQAQVDSMLAAIGGLSDADYVRSIIREGESKKVEFKETFSLNLRHDTGQKDKVMEDMCLKTIAALLNSDGGHLLIGVADDGTIAGLSPEIAKFHKDSTDKFLLNFKNTIEKRIGPEFYPFIDYRLVEVDGKNPMVVQCKPSQKPCFLDAEVFYVRTNPATDKLVGSKQLEYIRHRFGM